MVLNTLHCQVILVASFLGCAAANKNLRYIRRRRHDPSIRTYKTIISEIELQIHSTIPISELNLLPFDRIEQTMDKARQTHEQLKSCAAKSQSWFRSIIIVSRFAELASDMFGRTVVQGVLRGDKKPIAANNVRRTIQPEGYISFLILYMDAKNASCQRQKTITDGWRSGMWQRN